MSKRLLLCAIAVTAVEFGASSVSAECDPPILSTTLLQSGGWFSPDPEIWDNGPPNECLIAIIPDGKTASVSYGGGPIGYAYAVEIQSDGQGTTTGRIEIEPDKTLRISHDSVLNGVLCVYDRATLEISGNVTFTGSGGLEPESEDTNNPGVVRGVTSTDTLTLASGFVLKGAADFQVKLINNGTVIATALTQSVYRGTIRLSGEPKSGSGTWSTEGLNGKFEVATNLTIDGQMNINADGTLEVQGNRTINGSGSIRLNHSTAIVSGPTVDDVLVLASGQTLMGKGEVQVTLANSGRVKASDGTLRLTTNTKSGSGVWEAVSATGILKVETGVIDGGAWTLADHSAAKIVIDSACSCLQGPVSVTKGTLQVNQNFKTSGNLSMGGIDSLIEVAGGKVAKFGTATGCGGGSS